MSEKLSTQNLISQLSFPHLTHLSVFNIWCHEDSAGETKSFPHLQFGSYAISRL